MIRHIDEARLENDVAYRFAYVTEFMGLDAQDIQAIHGAAAHLAPVVRGGRPRRCFSNCGLPSPGHGPRSLMSSFTTRIRRSPTTSMTLSSTRKCANGWERRLPAPPGSNEAIQDTGRAALFTSRRPPGPAAAERSEQDCSDLLGRDGVD